MTILLLTFQKTKAFLTLKLTSIILTLQVIKIFNSELMI